MRFLIHSPSDQAADPKVWRDLWIKQSLRTSLERHGHVPVDSVDSGSGLTHVWLLGAITQRIDPSARNLLWVVSHPDFLLGLSGHAAALRMFERIFVASKRFAAKLAEIHPQVSFLACPAPLRDGENPYAPWVDLSHVGNTDPSKRREILAKVAKDFSYHFVGPGWKELGLMVADYGQAIPSRSASFIPWDDMPKVWNCSRIALHSAHRDMVREGFLPEAVLDIITHSGALPLCDSDIGLADHGFDLPFWRDEIGLRELIAYFLHPDQTAERQSLVEAAKEVCKGITWDHVAEEILG